MSKRIIALLLALVMVLCLAACGDSNKPADGGSDGNTDQNPSDNQTPGDDNTPGDNEGNTTPVEVDNRIAAEVQDEFKLSQEEYDQVSSEIYMDVWGDFYDAYQTALAETDVDTRMVLMGIAEAKMLEAAVAIPGYDSGPGSYAISKIVPRSGTTVNWGYDEYRSDKNALLLDQPLTPEQRTELTAMWTELRGTGTYWETAKKWAEDNGFTIQTEYKTTFSTGYQPDNWDCLATNKTKVGQPLAYTVEPLLQYDCENIQQPALAESYDISEDGLTYTFHIRKGVQWVDYQGRAIAEVKADDWVAALQHIGDTDDGTGLVGVWSPAIVNLYEYASGEITDFSQVGVKAIDDYTLQYTLKAPTPWFLSSLGYSVAYPLCRSYFESQGGKFGQEFNAEDSAYTYGKDPQHIAYCGPYLVNEFTENSRLQYKVNPSYWDKDNVLITTITKIFNEGSVETFTWDCFLDGTTNSSVSLTSVTIPLAQQQMVEGENVSYYDKYAYVTTSHSSSYMWMFNLNRAQFSHNKDNTKMVSPKTVNDAQRWNTAVNNKNLRMAIALGFDRASYYALSYGDELRYVPLTNTYTPGDFMVTNKEVTVQVNGTDTTFPSGTWYGQVVQAQIDADEFPVTVWDPEGADGAGASEGFDGWYNPDLAAEYFATAIEELKAEGVEVTADNPLYMDIPCRAYSTSYSNQANQLKQNIESLTGGLIIVNILGADDSSMYSSNAYNTNRGYLVNEDFGNPSGWGPDYGDVQTYLDTLLPYYDGSRPKLLGIF